VRGSGGHTVAAYCECTYHRIERTGALRSRASLDALEQKLKPFERTHDPTRLPAFVRTAILGCLQYLPANSLNGPTVISKLPSLTHPRLPLKP
jgi:hypothetical protein